MSQTFNAVILTAVVTATVTFLLTYFFLRHSGESTKSISPLPKGPKEIRREKEAFNSSAAPGTEPSAPENEGASSYWKTYRAQGIPAGNTHESTKKLLQSVLGVDYEGLPIEVQSLAPNPYDPTGNVATFTYGGSLKRLPGPRKRWEFSIPNDEHSEHSVPPRKSQISIDSDFEGFTPLNSLGTDTDYKADCIAISGLGSHAFGSFKEKGGQHMWLRDSLPYDIPSLRVLIYGYDTHLHGSKSFQDLEAVSTSFRTALRAIRREPNNEETPKPLIFIAHSLGGLVLKKALCQMKSENDPVDKVNFESTYAVLFFGVPNQGLDITSLMPMANGQDNLRFLMNLGKDSELLRELHNTFSSTIGFNDSVIISYYETEKSPTARKKSNNEWKMDGEDAILVSISSATHGKGQAQAINRNHSEMVKFSSHDEIYYRIRDQMRDLTQRAVGVVEVRFSRKSELSLEQKKCLNELNNPPFWDIRNTKVSDPESGTLEWFFRRPDFESWLSEENSTKLWIRGSPGQGKSVLAKSVLNHLDQRVKPISNRGHSKVIYFFCYNQEKDFGTASSILRALIVQLLTSPQLFVHLLWKYQNDPKELMLAPLGTLWDIFRNLVCDPYYDTIYCVVDALDECEDSIIDILSRVRNLFAELVSKSRPRLKVLVTSRPVLEIVRELVGFTCIDLKAEEDDLEIFVNSKISTLPDQFTPELRGRATELLLGQAERTYLWVSIVVKQLERMTLPSVAELKTIVRKSSTNLNALYSDIVGQIMKDPLNQNQQKLVAWVAYARRPLTLRELEAALATQMDSENQRSTEDYRINLTATTLASAAGILLETKSNTVHLIHLSAKEFILQGKQLASASFANGLHLDLYLAKICMKYLSFDDFMEGPCGSFLKLSERRREYPLLDYASRKWHTHIQNKFDVDQVSNFLPRLIEPHSPILLSWGEAAGIKNLDAAHDTVEVLMKTGIVWLAECLPSNPEITKAQVRSAAQNVGKGYDIMEKLLSQDKATVTEETILEILGSFNGTILKLLLDHNDDIRVTNAMILAAAANEKSGRELIGLLLDKCKSIEIEKALVEEVANNKLSGKEVICFLLSRDDVKVTEEALAKIIESFDIEVTRLLIEGKWDIKITRKILEAIADNIEARDEVIELLLSRGDIQITESSAEFIVLWSGKELTELLLSTVDTPITTDTLIAVANKCDARVMKLWLDKGKDIQITGAILDAAKSNRYDSNATIELLLTSDNTRITEEVTIILAEGFDTSVMKLLLDEKEEIQNTDAVVEAAIRNDRNRSELMELLLSRRNERITEMIIRGASSKDELWELLWVARSKGHEEVIRLLLDKGAKDEEANSPKVREALESAAVSNHEARLRSLLDGGANIEAVSDYGFTPLHFAASRSNAAAVQVLLDKGANVEAKNDSGTTALQMAAYFGSGPVMQLLLEKGADIEAKDLNGMTALLHAASRNYEAGVKLLLEKGANINARNNEGKTAIDLATEDGIQEWRVGVTRLLNQHL